MMNPVVEWFKKPLVFTKDEQEAIEVDIATFTSEMALRDDVASEIVDGLTMLSLSNYCERCLDLARYGQVNDTEGDELIRKALEAKKKSFIVFPLPIILFQLGILYDFLGDGDLAIAMFNAFLDGQSKFSADEVQSTFLKHLVDADEAIAIAKQKLGL